MMSLLRSCDKIMNLMIRTIFNPGNYPKNIDFSLLLLRVATGAFMLTHGWGKFLKLIGDEPIMFADPIGIGETASLVLVVFSEVLCSMLLIFGAATRLAAIPLIITMLVAAFIIHADDGFGKQELPLLYTTIYIVFALAGAGKFSVDNWIYNKIRLS
jgi:putative oxidoreductase